jgi:GNAT superfamily N-acetyltransferase
MPKMVAAKCYVGFVEDEPVCHLAVGSIHTGLGVEARACRLVVMPEWQGAGIGMRFLNWVCELQRTGGPGARLEGRPLKTLFHTSHPGLVAALRRDPAWRQVSAMLYGANKKRSAISIATRGIGTIKAGGYGGHFRAVQGFRYHGKPAA